MNTHINNALSIIGDLIKLRSEENLSDEAVLAGMAQAQMQATLALAYEQRTANLLHALEISARSQGTFDREELKLQVRERLGLK